MLGWFYTSRWYSVVEHCWRRRLQGEKGDVTRLRYEWSIEEVFPPLRLRIHESFQMFWCVWNSLNWMWRVYCVGVKCLSYPHKAAGNRGSLLAFWILLMHWSEKFARCIFKTEHYWHVEFILTSVLSYCDQVTRQPFVGQYDSFLCRIFLPVETTACTLNEWWSILMLIAWFLVANCFHTLGVFKSCKKFSIFSK